MGEIARDIWGNPVNWAPTGRRVVVNQRLHAEMRKDDSAIWPLCRPHEDCIACAELRAHDGCPVAQQKDGGT